jgi:hypothetical protein
MTQALAKVAPTDFSQPPPLTSLVDQLNAQKRGGINAGAAIPPADTPLGGPYVVGPVAPNAIPPPTTTSTTAPPLFVPPTTSTTLKR